LDDRLIGELEEIGGILATAASEPIARLDKIRESLEALGLTAELSEAEHLLRETWLDEAGEMISRIITNVAASRGSPQLLDDQQQS
jgi:hypothetical protein